MSTITQENTVKLELKPNEETLNIKFHSHNDNIFQHFCPGIVFLHQVNSTYLLTANCPVFDLSQGPVAPWETLHLQKYQRRYGHYICVYRSWRSFCYWRASVCGPWPLASGTCAHTHTHTDSYLKWKFPCFAFLFNVFIWPSVLPV